MYRLWYISRPDGFYFILINFPSLDTNNYIAIFVFLYQMMCITSIAIIFSLTSLKMPYQVGIPTHSEFVTFFSINLKKKTTSIAKTHNLKFLPIISVPKEINKLKRLRLRTNWFGSDWSNFNAVSTCMKRLCQPFLTTRFFSPWLTLCNNHRNIK